MVEFSQQSMVDWFSPP